MRNVFVLEYLSFHSLNHGYFQINCAIISSTTGFKLSFGYFSMELSSDSGISSFVSSIPISFTIISFRLLIFGSRTLINVSWNVLFNLMAEPSHYINNTEEEDPTKLTRKVKVKKTPDPDLGKPLLG